MSKLEQINGLVLEALQELNNDRPDPFTISDDTKLLGKNGVLDSMDLVNLTAEIEERLSDEMDIDITIASEKAFSRKKSPFYNINSLSSFILELSEG